jgi:hypothetical protein
VPCGFQFSAILSTAFESYLIVCPIHFHFRLLSKVLLVFSCFPHNIVLLITSDHRIFNYIANTILEFHLRYELYILSCTVRCKCQHVDMLS